MFVVTLPISAEKNPDAFARKAKKAGADILEIRTDLTPKVEIFKSVLPILLAIRGSDAGLIDKLQPKYIDREISEIQKTAKGTSVFGRQYSKKKPIKSIRSFHDYKKTPALEVMEKIVQKMCSENSWMIKISTYINSERDLITLQKIQSLLNKKSVRSTVLGMGPKAHVTRILSPIRNTCTYTFLDGTEPAATGQLSLDFYKLTKHVQKPKVFGILGGPHIAKSLSPLVHNALFHKHTIDAVYSCFPSENFDDSLESLNALSISGLSVTAPFKERTYQYAAKKDAITKSLHVANTLVRKNKFWHCYVTDVDGVQHGYPMLARARSIAILGAGGAVPSIVLAVQHLAPDALITVFARDIEKAATLLHSFAVTVRDLTEAKKTLADCVICAISEDTQVPVPRPQKSSACAIDLRYGTTTSFMKDAASSGYKVYDGIPMLIQQALKQFFYFTGKKPAKDDAKYLRKILRSMTSL